VSLSRPKGSFWWKALLKLITTFKGIFRADIKDGQTVLLWQNLWNNNISMQMPEFSSYSSSPAGTMAQNTTLQNLYGIFHTPFSEEVFQQYNLLIQELQEMSLSHDRLMDLYLRVDKFLSSKGYQALLESLPTHPALKLLWKTKCQPKNSLFLASSAKQIKHEG
jgi:hypothetical protein